MVNEALAAAEQLAAEGIDVEVIDPRRCSRSTPTRSSRRSKTNRAVVVHEAVRFGGLGAEIAAQIQEEAFDYLDAPVGRVGCAVLAGAVHAGARGALPALVRRHRGRHPRRRRPSLDRNHDPR